MTAVCIKTGADVYLRDHHATIHGDLFLVGSTYILALGAPADQCMTYNPPADFRCNMVASIYHRCGSRAVAWEIKHCSDFFYDGYHPSGVSK